jgi:hypothetical protein
VIAFIRFYSFPDRAEENDTGVAEEVAWPWGRGKILWHPMKN